MITVTEATASAGARKRPSDEDVPVRPDGLPRERVPSGKPAGPAGAGTVVGATADRAVRVTTAAGVRAAADVPRPVYGAAGGRDGRVPPEIGPGLDPAAVRSLAPFSASPVGSGNDGRLNPAHKDTRSVEEPVAPHVATTAPEAAPYATAGHRALRGGAVTGGDARVRVGQAAVERPGISYGEVVRQPAREGGARFGDVRQDLLGAVTKSHDSMGVDAE
ncbi:MULTISPECIES: hypothetical protein [Streptomyces]|uniref:Uncharacterized protein n=1 Tax=Streptomyces fimbriatus TaxID=68197 RepID=A0ABW0D4I2_STRFI